MQCGQLVKNHQLAYPAARNKCVMLTLFARMFSASAWASPQEPRSATSRPALARTTSTAALLNSSPVKVDTLAPLIAYLPIAVPTRRLSVDDCTNNETTEATGAGSKVLPGVCKAWSSF